MKQILRCTTLLATCIALLALPAFAGKFEKQIKRDWLGAWVVISNEVTSDCGAGYTSNRVNNGLTRGNGSYSFEEGELGKIQLMDIKRSRLDVRIRLMEPLRTPYVSGPFTLYRERECRVELEVMLDRENVKSQDMASVTAAMERIVERFTNESDARMSARYNERLIDPLPHDYELTLARHAAWQAETLNLSVQHKLDEALDVATDLSTRVKSDDEYLAGFADGVEQARDTTLDQCPVMLGLTLRKPYRRPKDSDTPAPPEPWTRGFADGRSLVWSLELMRRLPGCFVEVPPVPGEEHVAIVR